MTTQNTIVVTELNNTVKISAPGPQGPGGRTILNGVGAPSSNLGVTGDFYYDTVTTYFYGPKLLDTSWAGASNYALQQLPAEFSFEYSWSLNQVTGPVNYEHSVIIVHNLGFKPNVTVKNSAGDLVETGIDYNSNSQITLKMAQPFSGTAYLS